MIWVVDTRGLDKEHKTLYSRSIHSDRMLRCEHHRVTSYSPWIGIQLSVYWDANIIGVGVESHREYIFIMDDIDVDFVIIIFKLLVLPVAVQGLFRKVLES